MKYEAKSKNGFFSNMAGEVLFPSDMKKIQYKLFYGPFPADHPYRRTPHTAFPPGGV